VRRYGRREALRDRFRFGREFGRLRAGDEGLLLRWARALAGPAAAGLRELAGRAAPELLARPRVQQAWRQANRVAHEELLRVINGGGPLVSTRAGEVTLDVRTLVDQLAASLGLSQQLAAARQKLAGGAGAAVRGAAQQRLGVTLPPSAGRIVVLRSNQLEAAQKAAKAIRGLAWVMTGVSLLLFAVAIALASGWRRLALRTVGWCLIADGILVLLARRVGGGRLVDALVPPGSVRPAAHSAWTIGTSLLYDIAVAMVVYGLVLVCAAWLAGSTRPAVALRRTLAPALRFRVGASYAVVAMLFGLLLLWGPTPAFQKLVGILLFAVLIVVGVEALRRQTAHEFPDARPGDGLPWLRAHVREWRHPNGGSPRSGDAPAPTGAYGRPNDPGGV
jgi:hypothetical protein